MRLHTVLLTSSILAGLASAPAMAQTATPDAAAAAQAPAPQADTASNDDIVVTGIRESLRSAISGPRLFESAFGPPPGHAASETPVQRHLGATLPRRRLRAPLRGQAIMRGLCVFAVTFEYTGTWLISGD